MKSAERYINPSFFYGIFLPDWIFKLDLSNDARICYGKLARLAYQEGHAFPTIATLAEMLKSSESRMKAYLKELKDVGLLDVTRTGRASEYHLPWHPVMDESLKTGHKTAQKRAIRGAENETSDSPEMSYPYKDRIESQNLAKEPTKSEPKKVPHTWGTVEAFLTKYNVEAPSEWSRPKVITPARRDKIRKYLKDFPDESFWTTVFLNAKGSDFLRGLASNNGRKPFVADLDWILQKGKDNVENCAKTFEGKYNGKSFSPNSSPSGWKDADLS